MSVLIDLVGRRFGRLVVSHRHGTRVQPNGCKRPTFGCVCDCGQRVVVAGTNLRSGNSRSCGCLRAEMTAAKTKPTHGGSYTREYQSWAQAKCRCADPNHHAYKDYGGRGIAMCAAWRESFETFRRDMGPRPAGTSIDRINNDGDYEPGNCRWATRSQQQRNKRRRVVTAVSVSPGIVQSST
jgi:hypothetical protein